MIDFEFVQKNVLEGFVLNPSEKVVNEVIKALNKNEGECPCDNPGKEKADRMCPCKCYREDGKCCCSLYVEDYPQERDRIEIAVDLETLSLRPNAAIIAIAASPFSITGEFVRTTNKAPKVFFKDVNATTCIMYGLHVDADTCKWWFNQSKDAKAQFGIGWNIASVLIDFIRYVKNVKDANHAKEVHLWCQGTDFDIAILRNAIRVVLGEDSCWMKEICWKYNDVVDARTFIKENLRLLGFPLENPYDAIPKLEDHVSHNALSDVEQLIHNVTWVNDKVKESLKHE